MLAAAFVVCLSLPAGGATATLFEPPPGPVSPGDILEFSLTLEDFTQVNVDDRDQYPDFGCPPGKVTYTFRQSVVGWYTPLTAPEAEIPGDNAAPSGPFKYAIQVNADAAGVFFVDFTVVAPCESGASFFSASASFGPYTVEAASSPPPPPPPPPPPSPPPPPPPPLPPPPPPPPPQRTPSESGPDDSMQDCGKVLVKGRSVRVYVQSPSGFSIRSFFSQACEEARAVARGERIAGVSCSGPLGADPADRYKLCTKRKVIIVVSPNRTSAGPTGCKPVTHNGQEYKVVKARVLCTYARGTALRMLRRQDPYIYEFETPGRARRWSCHILGRGATERGHCYKQVEKRWLMYFPAPE